LDQNNRTQQSLFCISRQRNVVDSCLTARVFLFHRVIQFLFTRLSALKDMSG